MSYNTIWYFSYIHIHVPLLHSPILSLFCLPSVRYELDSIDLHLVNLLHLFQSSSSSNCVSDRRNSCGSLEVLPNNSPAPSESSEQFPCSPPSPKYLNTPDMIQVSDRSVTFTRECDSRRTYVSMSS